MSSSPSCWEQGSNLLTSVVGSACGLNRLFHSGPSCNESYLLNHLLSATHSRIHSIFCHVLYFIPRVNKKYISFLTFPFLHLSCMKLFASFTRLWSVSSSCGGRAIIPTCTRDCLSAIVTNLSIHLLVSDVPTDFKSCIPKLHIMTVSSFTESISLLSLLAAEARQAPP